MVQIVVAPHAVRFMRHLPRYGMYLRMYIHMNLNVILSFLVTVINNKTLPPQRSLYGMYLRIYTLMYVHMNLND